MYGSICVWVSDNPKFGICLRNIFFRLFRPNLWDLGKNGYAAALIVPLMILPINPQLAYDGYAVL